MSHLSRRAFLAGIITTATTPPRKVRAAGTPAAAGTSRDAAVSEPIRIEKRVEKLYKSRAARSPTICSS